MEEPDLPVVKIDPSGPTISISGSFSGSENLGIKTAPLPIGMFVLSEAICSDRGGASHVFAALSYQVRGFFTVFSVKGIESFGSNQLISSCFISSPGNSGGNSPKETINKKLMKRRDKIGVIVIHPRLLRYLLLMVRFEE